MKILSVLFFLGTLVACASEKTVKLPEENKIVSKAAEKILEEGKKDAAKKAEKPKPIPIPEAPSQPKTLADIDPETLKVTYHKGADPKAVVDQLVKSWADAAMKLSACQEQLKSAQSKK